MSEKSKPINWLKHHRDQYNLYRKRGTYGFWCLAVGVVIAAAGLYALKPMLLHIGLAVSLIGVTIAIWLFERAKVHARLYEERRIALEDLRNVRDVIGVWN